MKQRENPLNSYILFNNLAGTIPAHSDRKLLSNVITWETFATKFFDKPVSSGGIIALPGTFAKRRLELITTARIVFMRLLLKASEEMIDRPTVESKMKEVGADGVIVTTLVDKKTQKVQSSTYYADRGWYGHYSYRYSNPQVVRHRTTSYEYEVFNLETNLYEIQNQKMIWSSLSDTQIPYAQPGSFSEGAVNKAIKELIQNIVKRLSESQLI